MPTPSERGFDRLVNFGDAVVAIAITLLVLPLVELPTAEPELGLGDIVTDHWFELLAFLLSFVVIGRLWRVHHELFERIDTYDETIVQFHMLWLLTIVLLPFPTQMLGAGTNGRAESAFYIGTLTATSACLTMMRRHIDRTPALRERPPDPSPGRRDDTWATTTMFAVAFVLAATIPGVGAWALLLLAAERPILTTVARLRGRPPTASS